MARTGTYVVVAGDGVAPVLRDVHDGQVLTLGEPPVLPAGPLDRGEVIEARLEPTDAGAPTWRLANVTDRRSIALAHSAEPPTRLARELAADQPVGELTRRERAGAGELHVLTVPPDRTADAASEVLADDATLERAARLGVDRVEVRADAGVVSVRYLP